MTIRAGDPPWYACEANGSGLTVVGHGPDVCKQKKNGGNDPERQARVHEHQEREKERRELAQERAERRQAENDGQKGRHMHQQTPRPLAQAEKMSGLTL